jgi:hypothetical protein
MAAAIRAQGIEIQGTPLSRRFIERLNSQYSKRPMMDANEAAPNA